jgi:hypothetical protein
LDFFVYLFHFHPYFTRGSFLNYFLLLYIFSLTAHRKLQRCLPPSTPHGEHAHKTQSYDTKMILKDVFDKTLFVKFDISNNFNKKFRKHIQNNQKSIGKSIPANGFLKIFRKKPKLLQNLCDFQKKTIP